MKKIILTFCATLALGGCGSSVKETLGLERSTPDEFSVVERAPLTVPPNFDLAPPQDGVTPPATAQAASVTKQLVLGSQTSSGPTSTSRAEQLLLQKAGTPAPNIRSELAVDQDVAQPTSAAEKLGIVSPESTKGKALDPAEEAKKLQQQNVKTVPIKSVPEKK